jgi:uncharacterized protein YndB with AHSA1/START domain
MQATSQIALQVRRTFAAPGERIFRAWTDPKELAAWFSPSPDFTVVLPKLDLQAGGECRVEMHHKPSEKIAFTWQWEPAASRAETLFTVEFHDLGKSTESCSNPRVLYQREEKRSTMTAGMAASSI